MRFLGVLGLGLIVARLFRHVAGAVALADQPAAGVHGLGGEIDAVRAHVGDEAHRLAAEIGTLEQALGRLHRPVGREAELARGLLLQGRGAERRGRVAAHLLLLDLGHGKVAGQDRLHGAARVGLGLEVEAVELLSVEMGQAGGEGLALIRAQQGLDRPVFLRDEGLDLGLALADEAKCHGLDAAGRARALQLAPEDGGEAEADQIVEGTAGLVGVDQVVVELAAVPHGLQHGRLGDLVEHHPLDIDAFQHLLGLEQFQKVPGDRLTFPVGVGRKHEALCSLQRPRDLVDTSLFLLKRLVDDREVVLGIDRAILLRQVADMAVARQNGEPFAQILVDGLGLGRRFDDNDVHERAQVLQAAPVYAAVPWHPDMAACARPVNRP